jgi:UDP-N-acetyl-D-galactosamine dehydrogenase
MNELAVIFNRLDIDTLEVLEAAGTKWNFLNFRPGLVGGHCIGVDPYYLTYKAEVIGYHPQVILAGRRINDDMGRFVAENTVKEIIQAGGQVKNACVNVLGFSFKENCADIRNTKVVDVVRELESFGIDVFVHDPVANSAESVHEYGLPLVAWDDLPEAEALVVAVAHDEFINMNIDTLLSKLRKGGCFIDIKAKFNRGALENKEVKVWRL